MEIITHDKSSKISDIRHLYCKLRHDRHGISYTEIAKEIGRTHTAVSYGIARINDLLGIDDIKITRMWNSASTINGLSV